MPDQPEVKTKYSRVEGLKFAVSRLAAVKLIEEPGSLTEYGLEEPAAEVRFYDGGDKLLAHLQIGNEVGEKRRYVRNALENLLFEVETKELEKLLFTGAKEFVEPEKKDN